MSSYRRVLSPPPGSFFLFGVRGVGKSTWAEAAFPGAHFVDLLDEARHHSLLADPSLLGSELAALPRSQTVVLDEIQRVPALLNEVHRAIESSRRRFVLLGSSARRLKTAGTNLLAGAFQPNASDLLISCAGYFRSVGYSMPNCSR